ncbi:MAG: hypothetical protein U0790_21845 [Isosphaeraceae bacterium]
MLTVVATCRQQGRNVLEYLTSCLKPIVAAKLSPTLLPITTAEVKTT